MNSFSSTTPGPDTIGAVLIQRAYKVIPAIVNKVYKVLFTIEYYPQAWRSYISIVMPKVNKKDYSNPKSSGVISLLNCLGKVLEKIFATWLNYMANTTALLHVRK